VCGNAAALNAAYPNTPLLPSVLAKEEDRERGPLAAEMSLRTIRHGKTESQNRPVEDMHMAQWQMTYMRPQDIIVKPKVRKEYDPRKQEELTASVKALGVLMALLVMPSRVLLAGHRRLMAAIAAGLEAVPVIITDRLLSDSEILVIQLTENMHRADLKAIEQVEGVEEVARLNPEMTNKDLAKLLGFEASMITRLRSAAKVIPSVREAFAGEKIGLSTVYAISKCESPADQERMLAQALSGASRDAIEQVGRRSRKEKTTRG
jgi:ParB family chromosome partitioning protein